MYSLSGSVPLSRVHSKTIIIIIIDYFFFYVCVYVYAEVWQEADSKVSPPSGEKRIF